MRYLGYGRMPKKQKKKKAPKAPDKNELAVQSGRAVRTKPYVGRTFLVKDTSGKPPRYKRRWTLYRTKGCSPYTNFFGGKKNFWELSAKEMGEAVLVVDEGASRVKVIPANGTPGWVSRGILGPEVLPEDEENKLKDVHEGVINVLEQMRDTKNILQAKPKKHRSPCDVQILERIEELTKELATLLTSTQNKE